MSLHSLDLVSQTVFLTFVSGPQPKLIQAKYPITPEALGFHCLGTLPRRRPPLPPSGLPTQQAVRIGAVGAQGVLVPGAHLEEAMNPSVREEGSETSGEECFYC